MKLSGFDWLLVILAALVLLAMAATLLFSTGHSRHGYGNDSAPRHALFVARY